MKRWDQKLDRLFALARRDKNQPVTEAPQLFCRMVVSRWLAETDTANGNQSWNRSVRYGFAFASAAMIASVAWNLHLWWQADLPEQVAAEAVAWIALPK